MRAWARWWLGTLRWYWLCATSVWMVVDMRQGRIFSVHLTMTAAGRHYRQLRDQGYRGVDVYRHQVRL